MKLKGRVFVSRVTSKGVLLVASGGTSFWAFVSDDVKPLFKEGTLVDLDVSIEIRQKGERVYIILKGGA